MMFDRDRLNRLYRYAFTLTCDESEAFDLVQDTVERCLKNPPHSTHALDAWARRILRNRFIDIKRRQSVVEELPASEAIDTELVAIDVSSLEQVIIDQDQLRRIWAKLQPVEREILYYWAVEEMSAEEIADVMATRRGTVLSRIHRLRKRLMEETASMDNENEGRS